MPGVDILSILEPPRVPPFMSYDPSLLASGGGWPFGLFQALFSPDELEQNLDEDRTLSGESYFWKI